MKNKKTMQLDGKGNFHKGHFTEKNIELSLNGVEFDDCYITLQNEDLNECPYTNAWDFLHGACDLFAYVLHKKFGFTIFELIDKSNHMVHCFCKSYYCERDVYIDVRGATTDIKEFFSEFNNGAKITCKNILEPNFKDDWVQTGIVFASAIIEKYYDYYDIE